MDRKRVTKYSYVVNLSARQFQQKNITEIIENIILEEKLDPKYLDIEITETTAIEDIDFTIENDKY